MSEKLLGKMNDTSTFLMNACEYCAYQESAKPCAKKRPGKKYVSSITHVKTWKVLDLLKALMAEYKTISYDCVSIFVHTFKQFEQNYAFNNVKIQQFTIRLSLYQSDQLRDTTH